MMSFVFWKITLAALRHQLGKIPGSTNFESNSLSILLFRIGLKHRILSKVGSGKNDHKAPQ